MKNRALFFSILLICAGLWSRPIRFHITNSESGLQEPARVRIVQGTASILPSVREEDPGQMPSGGWFHTWGDFTADVPAGATTVQVERHYFFRSATYNFDVPASGSSDVTLKLYPWIDLNGHQWYTGDTHLHRQRNLLKSDQHLLYWACNGRNVAYNFAFNLETDYSPVPSMQQAPQMVGMGDRSNYIRGLFAVTSGQEYIAPQGIFGHNGVLCADSLVPANGMGTKPNVYPPAAVIFDQARALNGFMISHHCYSASGHAEAVIDAGLGKTDAIELNQMVGLNGNYQWSVARNSGTVPAHMVGSDNNLVEGLNIAYVGDSLTPREFMKNVSWGRVQNTKGAYVFFRIQNKGQGEFVTYPGSGAQTVELEAVAFSEITPLKAIHIRRNGAYNFSVKTATADSGGKRAYIKTTVSVTRSSWFVAIAEAQTGGALAMSGAITVMLDRQLPAIGSNQDNNVASLNDAVDEAQTRLNAIQGGSYGTTAQKAETVALYTKALNFFKSLQTAPPSNDPAPGAVTGLSARTSPRTHAQFLTIPPVIPAPAQYTPVWN